MDDNLQKLKHELRSQKCPPEVLARVRERIAREHRRPAVSRGFAMLAGGAAALALIAMATLPWSREPERVPPPSRETRLTAMDAARVAEETRLSLACIGHVLLQARDHSETVILKEALPPLRSGFNTLQSTLKNPKGSGT